MRQSRDDIVSKLEHYGAQLREGTRQTMQRHSLQEEYTAYALEKDVMSHET